jgi:acylphosphatase
MKKRIHLIIKGRVQGVWFRASTQEKAMELGLTGWVRNRRDGSVEVMAEGDAIKVEELKNWCYKGPRGAMVSQVDSEELEFLGDLDRFEIRPTV